MKVHWREDLAGMCLFFLSLPVYVFTFIATIDRSHTVMQFTI